MKSIVYDGHVHSPYCPHGSSAAISEYIETLIHDGYEGVTFCEHAPLPERFVDPTPNSDSAMTLESLAKYLDELQKLKKEYESKLTINVGLEVDYIEGYETETKAFLDEYGRFLDDSILSVHFIHTSAGYFCIDYSAEVFQMYANQFSSIDEAVWHYYKTVQRSVTCHLGVFKPRRIGHPTLARKFQKSLPYPTDDQWIRDTLLCIKNEGMQVDVNGAGVNKPGCQEPYPPLSFLKEKEAEGLHLVYGSDAHHPHGLSQGREQLRGVRLQVPLDVNKI
ncbi:histidinol-phosphatase [Geomicrobium sp. JCM 19037]|uniref:histidinol-phosphatase HisJ n=1 Tax=unclassified Geomicrobium TaxID=2628951 RepID=UPI00045F1835|nr:histidinol-phosphatase HisJ [Geomicrobium sp. JCM 19037]GAK02902.1 histidinol-phosphatase [Geomicrobium sp. JCM 19037]